MSLEPRNGKPYIWPTWIAGLVAGEKSCEWAAWLKAHYFHDKRPQDNEVELLRWKAEHAAMVRATARDLDALGAEVLVEEQNKFTYRGKAANVGGQPDITALSRERSLEIVDCKTGQERSADVVQVAIYMMLYPISDAATRPLLVGGRVAYRTRSRIVSEEELDGLRPLIIDRIKRAAAPEEPRRTPSAGECRFCDILDCPERIVAPPPPETEPEPAAGALF